MATLFFSRVMYVNRLELGDIPATGPLRQHYLPGLAVERFSNHRRPLHLGLDHRFSRRLTVRHFTHGTQSLPLGHWHLLCRTVSQRAADRAVLYWYLVVPEFLPENIGMWFKSELDPNIQFFVSSMLCLGLFTAARVCEQVRAAIQSLPRGQKNAGLAMGLTLPQTYRYVLLPNAYRVIVPPMTSEMMNLVKNSAIASTIGLADMAAQAGKLLDYSAHARESFTAITTAYVFINAVIMLIMYVVERKVRLPGNMGGK